MSSGAPAPARPAGCRLALLTLPLILLAGCAGAPAADLEQDPIGWLLTADDGPKAPHMLRFSGTYQRIDVEAPLIHVSSTQVGVGRVDTPEGPIMTGEGPVDISFFGLVVHRLNATLRTGDGEPVRIEDTTVRLRHTSPWTIEGVDAVLANHIMVVQGHLMAAAFESARLGGTMPVRERYLALGSDASGLVVADVWVADGSRDPLGRGRLVSDPGTYLVRHGVLGFDTSAIVIVEDATSVAVLQLANATLGARPVPVPHFEAREASGPITIDIGNGTAEGLLAVDQLWSAEPNELGAPSTVAPLIEARLETRFVGAGPRVELQLAPGRSETVWLMVREIGGVGSAPRTTMDVELPRLAAAVGREWVATPDPEAASALEDRRLGHLFENFTGPVTTIAPYGTMFLPIRVGAPEDLPPGPYGAVGVVRSPASAPARFHLDVTVIE